MAEQEKPAEGRRRREDKPDESAGRLGEVLLWMLVPGGILLGWVPGDWPGGGLGFPLRAPVQVHQVPMTAEGGTLGCAQLYMALPVDALWIERGALTATTEIPRDGEIARLHGEACRQRTGAGLLLARAGGRLAH